MNPILSISMLVSRNRDTLEKCLQSLQPFFDELQAELVVVDTGAPKEAIELVKKYTDQIVSFAWCNDFSAARNAGLKVCTGEWFLYVDDDEWFEDVGDLIRFLKSPDAKRYQRVCYVQRNYSDFSGENYDDVNVERMEKRTGHLHFEHKIHEELTPVEGDIYYSGAYVHHYGYVYQNEEDRRRHNERNLTLLREECRVYPSDLRIQLHLLQELLIQGMYEEAKEKAQQQLAFALEQADVRAGNFFSWLCEMYVKCLFLLGQYDVLFDFADALQTLPDCACLGKLTGCYYAMLACVNQDQGSKNYLYADQAYSLQNVLISQPDLLEQQEIQGLRRYTEKECREVVLQLLSIFAYQLGKREESLRLINELTFQYDPYALAHICQDIKAVLQEN